MDEVRLLLTSTGAVLEGHFQLTSELHSNVYVEKFRLLEDPEVLSRLGELMAEPFVESNVNVVLGAAIGGILLSSATAKVLGTHSIFAERVDGTLELRRGFSLNSHERVLVVEDIVTTGSSVSELLGIVKHAGAEAVGVVCIVDRSKSGVDFGEKTVALTRLPSVSWNPEDCPLCKTGKKLKSRGRTGKV